MIPQRDRTGLHRAFFLYRWRVAGYQAVSIAKVSAVDFPSEEVTTEVESTGDKSSSIGSDFLFFGISKAPGDFHPCWAF